MQAQWIVVDSVPGRTMSLLQVGDDFYKDASVRKNLSQVARVLLRARLEDAVLRGCHFDGTEAQGGRTWRVVVRPILSPYSHYPVGALGIYVEHGHPLPPAPLVGSMEWVVDPTGERFSQWDRAMYEIYHLDPSDPAVEKVSPTLWLSRFVAQEDQDRLQKLIAEGLETTVTNRAVISYHVLTPPERRKKLLEMSVQKHVQDDGKILLRGITRQVPGAGQDVLPVEVDAPSSALNALAELTQEIPLAQVDFRDWRLFQVSDGWHIAGLGDPQEHTLLELVHLEDRKRVQAALEAQREDADLGAVVDIKVRMNSGCYRQADMSYKVLPHRYAMVRLRLR